MKKILSAVLALTIVFAMTACSNGTDNDNANGDTTTSAESSADTSADTSAEDSEETSAETEAPVVSDTSADDTSAEDAAGEEAGELSASSILQTIRDAYGENYVPNMEIPAEIISGTYGLSEDMYTEIASEMPMISANNDVVIIVKAAEGKIEDVLAALNNARDVMMNDSLQYPMNIAKTNAAKVISSGDYAAFMVLGAIDDRDDASDEERATFAEEQVQIGVDAFNSNF